MANTTISPNMNLVIPTVGVDPGPDWANNLNASLTILDQHNHTSGSGVQITPAAMNINSDLPFGSNNATLLRSVRFDAQPAAISGASDLGCLYEAGVDLYYNDGDGNQIRITQSGGVVGSPGSISNLTSPASATYVSANQTFVWQSAANTPANLDAGYLILRNNVANSKGLTLSPPAAMGSNYTITLPSLPAQNNVITIDSSGNMGSVTWDQVGQNMSSVGANAIGITMNSTGANAVGATMTATGANAVANTRTRATGSTVGVGGVAISSSCNHFTTTAANTSPADITNLSVTITTSGRPVRVGLISDGNVNTGGGFGAAYLDNSWVGVLSGAATTASVWIITLRNGANVASQIIPFNGGTSGQILGHPSAGISFIDFPPAGTYTYKLQMCQIGTITAACYNSVLVAYEL